MRLTVFCNSPFPSVKGSFKESWSNCLLLPYSPCYCEHTGPLCSFCPCLASDVVASLLTERMDEWNVFIISSIYLNYLKLLVD